MANWFQQESQDKLMGKNSFFSNYQYNIIYSKDIRKKQEEIVNNFVSKSLNFHEMNKFLEKYNLPKWTEEMEYQYCPVYTINVESLILPQRNLQALMASQ